MSLPHYDETAPFEALQRAGVQIARSTSTNTFKVEGIDVSSSSTEKFTFTLLQPVAFQGGFGKEGVMQKLSKVFTKEVQAGDPSFDNKVFVRGSDEKIRAFLQNEDVKALILDIVAPGGSIAVDGNKVHIAASLNVASTDRDIARLVCHLMAFA